MRNSWKVASWEVKKNMMNKSFIISIFLTPLLILAFSFIPSLLAGFGSDGSAADDTTGGPNETMTIYAIDELQIIEEANQLLQEKNSEFRLEPFTGSENELREKVQGQEELGYVVLDQKVLETKQFNFYSGGDSVPSYEELFQALTHALDVQVLKNTGVESSTIEYITSPYSYHEAPLASKDTDFLKKLIPGGVAGVILFGILMTGMMQFQSAVQEKRDKVSEILLSSITPTDLMQGKIIGYFLLGMIQIGVWLAIGIPAVSIGFDLPILSYLLNGHFLLLLTYAIGGYLLFSAIFVALGATMDDLNTSSNFQGIVLMLPFLPFVLISPVVSDVNGVIATVASYIPITAPVIMVLRLSIADQLPMLDIILSLIILIGSIWITMKIAGKIFKTGIMMYGKNATLSEIWKWIRQ